MKAAVIGIGSNSLRLLVADIQNGIPAAVLRDRIGLRVFASLNQRHEIGADMMHNACEAVSMLKAAAIKHGTEYVRLFATSAVRDAANKAAFADVLKQKTGLTLDILSGEMEAKLSYLGAAGEANAGMIDIGGGSTEIVIGDHGHTDYAVSLQIGAVRLFRELPIRSAKDLNAVVAIVQELIAPHMDQIKQQKIPGEWIGVGGTLTAAATCVQGIPWDLTERIHGFIAKRTEIKRITQRYASISPQKHEAIGSVPPDRADIIVHGFAILLSCMEALDIDKIKVSVQTNLDGYLRWITKGV